MATVVNLNSEWAKVYDGFDNQLVGLGAIEPTIYHSKAYQKKKQRGQNVLIGGINRLMYAGYEHDRQPLVLALGYEPQYNTLIGYNLHYCPYTVRKAIVDMVLRTNIARIKGKKPILIDYQAIKAAIPDSQRIVRRYKVIGVRVEETVPLVEWRQVIREKSGWENWYKSQGK